MSKKRFYAVVQGFTPGVFDNWDNCEKSIKGYKGQKYKGFSSEKEAVNWYRDNGGNMELLSLNKSKKESHGKSVEKDAIENTSYECDNAPESVIHNEHNSLIAKLKIKLSTLRTSDSDITEDFKEFCVNYPQFKRLSLSQKIAAQTVTGKSLLFAVPGSGKTTVLIAHAGFLVYGQKSRPITPDRLMNLTFTVPAAREMANRYKREFHPAADKQPAFRTIHSFCYSEILPALKAHGYSVDLDLVDTSKKAIQNAMAIDYDDDAETYQEEKAKPGDNPSSGKATSYSILKAVMKRFHLSARDETVREKVSSLITSIKNRQLSPEDYADKVISIKKEEYYVKEIYEAYQEELKKNNCMDFDDMLQYSLLGLQLYPNVLKEIQSKYSYWSIDETQDNSKLQNTLLSLIVGDAGNLFVVGDDDQSIYNFRGAEPTLLLRYGVKGNVKAMVMDTNYRSCSLIVNVAKNFIEENINRANKQMSSKSNAARGEINFVANLPSEQHQYRYIVETAMSCIREEKSLAIIYRQNASAFPLMFWLKKYNIKFHVAKDYQELAYGKVFRDIINIMKLAVEPGNWEAFNSCRFALKIFVEKDVLVRLSRYIKNGHHVQSVLDWITEKQENLRSRVICAKNILDQIKSKSPFEAVKYLLEEVFCKKATSTPSATDRLRGYAVLAACVPYRTIAEFLSMHSMLLDEAKSDNDINSCITLTSMHSSKGLEFDHVMIVDAWEDIIQGDHGKKYNEFDYEDAEESRRIFYVAITRAENTLDFLMPQKYFGNAEKPCRFIVDLMQAYEMFANASVQHLPKQIPALDSSFSLHLPQVYYGVRRGVQTGVFDNWTDTKRAVEGYAGQEYKKFYSLNEAENYVKRYADAGIPLSFPTLSSMMSDMHPETFMCPVDLPTALTVAILQWFGVHSLFELTPDRVRAIKTQRIAYTDKQETNYQGKVDYYILAYMIVNFYKVWAPLQKLLKSQRIKTTLKILELGAGPGTSAISLIYFFQLLARDNPKQNFSLYYNIVEREEDFIAALKSLMSNYLRQSVVHNLQIKWSVQKEDIYSFAQNMPNENEYDLIIESNVLNGNENLQSQKSQHFASELANNLAEGGSLILIEPGKTINAKELESIEDSLCCYDFICCDISACKAKVIVKDISLYTAVKQLGLRNDKRDEHWFTYSLFRKGCMTA